MAGLRPSLFDRRQNFCYDLGLRLRAVVSFAMQAQRDVAGFHVATTVVAQIGNLLFRRLAVGSS